MLPPYTLTLSSMKMASVETGSVAEMRDPNVRHSAKDSCGEMMPAFPSMYKIKPRKTVEKRVPTTANARMLRRKDSMHTKTVIVSLGRK